MDTHTHTNDSTHPAILQRPVFAETHTYTHECTTHLFSTLAFADTHTHTQRPVTHTHTHTHTHTRTYQHFRLKSRGKSDSRRRVPVDWHLKRRIRQRGVQPQGESDGSERSEYRGNAIT